MAGKEGEKTTGFLSFFKRLTQRIKTGLVLDKPENVLANETMLMSSQLRQRKKYGVDDFSKENIRGYLQNLNEQGFFCRTDSDGESTLTESEDQDKVLVTTDTGVRLSVDGITSGDLCLNIDGRKLSVPNSDPRYLEPMIVREILRVEMK